MFSINLVYDSATLDLDIMWEREKIHLKFGRDILNGLFPESFLDLVSSFEKLCLMSETSVIIFNVRHNFLFQNLFAKVCFVKITKKRKQKNKI